jgi:hypothetical protein
VNSPAETVVSIISVVVSSSEEPVWVIVADVSVEAKDDSVVGNIVVVPVSLMSVVENSFDVSVDDVGSEFDPSLFVEAKFDSVFGKTVM